MDLRSSFRSAWACSLILVWILILGCKSPVPSTGHIYVDHPEAFTRERLLNRRLDEQAWLEAQLKENAPFSLQGSIDTRDLVGMAAAVSGNFDPLGGAQAQSALQNVQNSSRVQDLQQELQIAQLKKQIESVENLTNASVPVPAFPTNLSNPAPSATNPMVSSPITINLGTFGTNLPALPNPANRVGISPGTSLTAVQTLDDQLAKRNYLEALLREQELDDTHDLAGMTLYTLKFDVSVVPGAGNSSLGEVAISIQD